MVSPRGPMLIKYEVIPKTITELIHWMTRLQIRKKRSCSSVRNGILEAILFIKQGKCLIKFLSGEEFSQFSLPIQSWLRDEKVSFIYASMHRLPIAADITSKESIQKLVDEISAKESKLHILINNAGTSSPTQNTDQGDPKAL